MNKLALAFSIGCALLNGAANAQDSDIPHNIAIYGKLAAAPVSCTVLMNKYVIDLHNNGNALPAQDQAPGVSDDVVYIRLGGESCDADEGYKKIGLKFVGTPDNALGNVLANTASGSSAAQGTGIRLSDMRNNTIIPNSVSLFPAAYENEPTGASFPLHLTLVKLQDQEAKPGQVQTNLVVQIERL